MGKKKGQPGGHHASQSFAELVGKANREALKPFILEVVGEVGNDISKRVMTKMAILQNRLQALEGLLMAELDFTQNDLDTALFDLEDRVTDYQRVDRPAQEKDLLRVTMRIKKVGEEYGTPQKREFSNLGLPPYALGVEFIEKALLGAVVGTPVVVPFDADLQKATKTEAIEFTVDRISEKIPKPEESENGKSQTTSESTSSPESGEAGQAQNRK